LKYLKKSGIRPIKTADIACEFNVSLEAAAQTLKRLSGAEVIPKLSRGVYWNPFYPPENSFCLHQVIAVDSYISLQTALWMHGIIEQKPYLITSIRWAGKSFECTNEYGWYRFTRFPERLIFGYYNYTEKMIWVAEPEKALLDYFYYLLKIRKTTPRLQELWLDRFDKNKFLEYAEKMELLDFLKETGLDNPKKWPELEPVGVV
jgi:predicted transcriptional regulator of viral defense system